MKVEIHKIQSETMIERAEDSYQGKRWARQEETAATRIGLSPGHARYVTGLHEEVPGTLSEATE